MKIWKYLARRSVNPKFARLIAQRLLSPRVYRHPVSVSRIARANRFRKESIPVIVATVTNDSRFQPKEFPKMRVAALAFTAAARKRIEEAGGECLTLDKLALIAPTGKKTQLLKGKVNNRKVVKFYGKPNKRGGPQNKLGAKSGKNWKGRGPEKGRGRRASRGWVVGTKKGAV